MFIAALFIIVKTWKQLRCAPRDEEINLVNPTVEYCSVLKGEKSSHGKTQKKLECTLLSESSQSEKGIYFMVPAI